MELRFRPDGTFRIIQFTDTHIGNMPFHEDDFRTFELIQSALEHFDVDLIIHTGDIIWSEGVKDAHIVFRRCLEYFNQSEIPMAITFGNHDAEEIITRQDLRDIFDEMIDARPNKENSFIIEDRESYTIEIKGHDSQEVERVIYMIDSGAEDHLGFGTYDWVLPEQVEWFREVSKKYRRGDRIKRNLVFQHIPVPEYWAATKNILDGVNHETNERISAPHINTGLFANMLLDGETWGMFVGHDHDNDFDGLVHGVHLVYGNVSGYQTYGDQERGVRIIELNQFDDSVTTYRVKANEFI